MFSEGDIGVLPPLGVYDPLGLIETRDMRRYQIMLFCLFQETGYGLGLAKGQTGGYASNPDNNEDDGEVGDIAGIPWVRYDDPETKTFKLNAERQNGRAAMLGITGCLVHEILGVDALYPTG